MGTKNNPGPYDCYAKLDPDEPYFLLRANDPTAVDVVHHWITVNDPIQSKEKMGEAAICMRDMLVWRRDNNLD